MISKILTSNDNFFFSEILFTNLKYTFYFQIYNSPVSVLWEYNGCNKIYINFQNSEKSAKVFKFEFESFKV